HHVDDNKELDVKVEEEYEETDAHNEDEKETAALKQDERKQDEKVVKSDGEKRSDNDVGAGCEDGRKAADDFEGDDQRDKMFRRLRLLKEGGFGKIYIVQKMQGPNALQLYAMKVELKEELDEDAFQTPTESCLILDFFDHGSLFDILKKGVIFDEEQTKFYAAQLTLALEYLHKIRIIHRNLKPEK
uniref:Protein kinase domain-containing protein n=1 Tax=Panagrolaimus sp. ES5 TaxID=591445 RepID=A0AC34GEP3_9BILA